MSLYIPEKSAFFIHIQRTGGGWVKETTRRLLYGKSTRLIGLRPHTIQYNHRPAGTFLLNRNRDYFKIKDGSLNFDFVWSQVRHPVAYYESVWGWLKKDAHGIRDALKEHWTWNPLRIPAILYTDDFNEWARRMIASEGAWVTRLFWMYVGPPGGEFCHFIGKTENLQNDFISALVHMGYKGLNQKQMDIIGETRRPHTTGRVRKKVEWDENLLKRVVNEERLVINRWYL